MTQSAHVPAPGLPYPLGRLIGATARPFGQALLVALANRALAEQRADGMVDFLADRVLEITVTDLDLTWAFTYRDDRIHAVHPAGRADVSVRADSASLLLLASRRADPDTLFFRRRLMMEGDTELGLQVKNLLDTIEPEQLPPGLGRLLEEGGRLAERVSD